MSRSSETGSPSLPAPPRSHALELVCERFYLREVLRSLLHTILFNRLLFASSHTRPREVEMNAIDFAYVKVDDPEVERIVEERLAHFIRLVDSATPSSAQGVPPPPPPSSSQYGHIGMSMMRRNSSFLQGIPVVRSQLTLAFSERRSKKSWFAGSYDEDVVWEEWIVAVSVKNSKTDSEHEASKRTLEAELPSLLMKVAALANDNRDAIPKLTSPPTPSMNESTTGSALGSNPFPWSIAVGSASQGFLPSPVDPTESVPPARPSGYILDEDIPGAGRNAGTSSTSWTSLLKRVVSDTASVAGLGTSMGGLSR